MYLRKIIFVWLLAAGLILTVASPTPAQVNTVNLSGSVLDPSGAVVNGAKITLKNLATGAERTATSDAAGRYEVVGLPPGNYSLTVEAPDFAKLTNPSLTLILGVAAEYNPQLGLQATAQTVSVTAGPELIETTKTDVSQSITSLQITNLPINGRNYINFTLLDSQANRDSAPSIGAAPTSGLNFGGQRARSNEVSVDGADAVDNSVNGVRATVSQEAVQEFQLITSNYMPEYGRATGGVVNIVTKSGSNEVHGNLFGFLRHKSIQARNPFSVQVALNPATETFTETGVKQPFTRVQAGATIGGPIRKDKTFYFFSYETTRRQETGFTNIGADNFGFVPSAIPCFPAPLLMTPSQATFYTGGITAAGGCGSPFAAPLIQAAGITGLSSATAVFGNAPGGPKAFPLPIDCNPSVPGSCGLANVVPLPASYVPLAGLIGNYPVKEGTSLWSLKLDQIWNQKNSSFVRASVSPSLVTGIQVNAQNQNFGQNAASRTSLQQTRDWSLVGQHTTSIRDNLFNEFRYQFARRGLHYGFSQLPGGDQVAVNITGFAFFGREQFSTVDRIERRNEWTDNLTWTRGGHTFKFGGDTNLVQIRSNKAEVFELNFGGLFNFGALNPNPINSALPPFTAVQAYGLGLPTVFIQGIGHSNRPFDNKALGVFAQDSWRINSRFTLNYGVRYDIEWIPTFKPGTPLNAAAEPALGVVEGIPVDSNNVQPRIGIAWDPTGSGKTVIRAGYGLYYDHPLLALAFDSTTADGALSSQLESGLGTPTGVPVTPLSAASAINSASIFQGVLGGIASGASCGPSLPANFGYLCQQQRFNALLPNSIFTSQNFIAQGFPIPILPFTLPTSNKFVYGAAQQANLTVERELSKDFKIGLAYNYTHGWHLNRPRNTNVANAGLLVSNANRAIMAGLAAPGSSPLGVGVPGPSQINTACPGPGGAMIPAVNITPSGPSIALIAPGILGSGFTLQNCSGSPIGLIATPAVFNFFRPSGPNPSFGALVASPLDPTGFNTLVALAKLAGYPTGFGVPVPWSDVLQQESSGNSVYHSFTLTVSKRFSHHFELLSNWTWSHAIDDSTDLQTLLAPQDNHFPQLERGNSSFDQRHRWVTSAVFLSPYKNSDSGFWRKFLADFTLAPIFDVSSGRPFTILTGTDFNMDFGSQTDRPSVVPVGTPGSVTSPFIKGVAFSIPTVCTGVTPTPLVPSPPLGCVGNLGRNKFTRPGFFTIDLRLSRKFPITERWNFEVIAEGFNMLNRFNAADVNPLCDPTSVCNAGQPSAALDPRQFQFALKLNW